MIFSTYVALNFINLLLIRLTNLSKVKTSSLFGAIYFTLVDIRVLGVLILLNIFCLLFVRIVHKFTLSKNYFYIYLLFLFLPHIVENFTDNILIQLGYSFIIVRQFITLNETLNFLKKQKLNSAKIFPFLHATFFIPTILVGPIHSGYATERNSKKSDEKLVFDIMFIWLILIILLPFLDLIVLELEKRINYPILPIYFLQLFLAFFGQSRIAEKFSEMHCIKVSNNFDQPWKATTIADFWKRWHISMADFVFKYFYFPLLKLKVNSKLATILSFSAMGLWHELAVGYLIWGFSHGLLLSFWTQLPEWKLLNIVVLWMSIITLSYVANYAFK